MGLITAFELLHWNVEKARSRGIYQLDRTLKTIKANIENNTEPAHDCALSQSEAEPDPSSKP
jgi:hypothetical protein